MASTAKKNDDEQTGDDPIEEIHNETDKDLHEWIQQFGTTGKIGVQLHRLSPTKHKGVKVDGWMETFNEPISVERVKDEYGGGKFQIKIQGYRKDKKSGRRKWGYIDSRTFDVAGPPKLEALMNSDEEADEKDDGAGNGENQTLASQAMNVMQQSVREARDEARDLRHVQGKGSGAGLEMMDRLLAPMQEQMNELSKRLAEKDNALIAALDKPADNTSQDRLFGIMESKETTHGNNLEAVRQQYESRISKLQDFHMEELRRYEARLEREISEVRSAAQREVDSLKTAHTSALDSQRLGYDMRIDGMKDITKRLEREVAKSETEVVELRTKKEQGPLDQIQGLVNLKQGFEALVPSGGDEKSGWERALDMAINSPVAEAVAGRFAQAAAQGPQEEAEDENQLIQVRLKDGRVVQMPRNIVARMQEQEAAKQAENAARKAAGEPEIPDVSDEDMAKAVAFMETAIRNGTDPAMFAASARNMLPNDILEGLRRLGVDVFMAKMAKLQTGSPLATVAGRAWARQVVEFLMTGEISDEPEPEEAPIDDIPDDLGEPDPTTSDDAVDSPSPVETE